MKCFIIAYNRLTWLKAMCEYLSDTGTEVIIIDNFSTYEPLLEWYDDVCPHKVHTMNKNYGHLVLWKSGLINDYKDRYYFVTDHDLDLSQVPHDYAEVLMKGLLNNPGVTKSGLSLRIDDLPANDYTKQVIDWEGKFWLNKRGNYYPADIDTTFALYDRERKTGLPPEDNRFFHAVRSEAPYSARHLFWYETPETIERNEEEKFYQQSTNTYWSQKLKETWS